MKRALFALRSVVVASVISSVAVPTVAAPADDPPRAKPAETAAVHFRRGVELYDEADFATALVEFRRAYETLPDFRVLYNIGQSEYQLQRYAAALSSFRRYLDEGGANVSSPRRAEVEREITRLEGRVARVRVTAEPGLDVFIDDEAAGRTPLSAPLVISAGRHRLRVVGRGSRPFERTLEVAGGDDISVPVRLEALASAAAGGDAPAPDAPVSQGAEALDPRVVGWTVAGLLAAGAVGTGVVALSSSSELENKKKRPPGAVTAAQLEEAASQAKTLALVTDVLGGAAIVAAGVSLYFTLKPSEKPRAGARLRLLPQGLTGVTVRGDF